MLELIVGQVFEGFFDIDGEFSSYAVDIDKGLLLGFVNKGRLFSCFFLGCTLFNFCFCFLFCFLFAMFFDFVLRFGLFGFTFSLEISWVHFYLFLFCFVPQDILFFIFSFESEHFYYFILSHGFSHCFLIINDFLQSFSVEVGSH